MSELSFVVSERLTAAAEVLQRMLKLMAGDEDEQSALTRLQFTHVLINERDSGSFDLPSSPQDTADPLKHIRSEHAG